MDPTTQYASDQFAVGIANHYDEEENIPKDLSPGDLSCDQADEII